MKIVVHLLYSSSLGGAERIVIALAMRGVRFKHIVLYRNSGELEAELFSNGVKAYKWEKYCNIYKIVSDLNPSIVIAHDYKMSIYASIFLNKGWVLFSYIHQANEWADSLNLKTLLYFFLRKRFYLIIYVSRFAKNSYFFNNRLKNAKVLHNPVLTKVSQSAKRDIDLIFVSRLEPIKRPELFIGLAALFRDKKAVIVGDGSLLTKLKKIASDNVEFVGWRQNVSDYLARSKIFVSTSKREGFGMVVLEAMQNGAIPLVINSGGVSEIIKHDENGLLSKDEKELERNCINLFAMDDSACEKYRKSMSRKVCDYDLDEYIIRIEELLEGSVR